MKLNSGFSNVKGLTIGALMVTAGFFVTKGVMSAAEPAPKKMGFDNAMQQAQQLMSVLQANDFEGWDYPMELLRLPEQDYVDLPSKRAPDARSFVLPIHTEGYEELAFICDTFVQREVTVTSETEGHATVTGYFIVGWKTGAINVYDVADVRLWPIPGNESGWLPVFPGMNEYASDLMTFVPPAPQQQQQSGGG